MDYFKKGGPATPIWLGNGRKLFFPTADGITGYFATDNPELSGILREAARNHRGGVTETDAADYDAYVKKKENSPPYKRESRFSEGIRASTPPDTIGRPIEPVAVTAVKSEPQPAPEPAPVVEHKPTEPQPIIKPKVGRPKKNQ